MSRAARSRTAVSEYWVTAGGRSRGMSPRRMRWFLVVVAALAGCKAESAFGDCAVSCETSLACPSGFICGAEGYCRDPAGVAQACVDVLADARLAGDGNHGGDDEPDAPGTHAGEQTDLVFVGVTSTT